MNKSNLKSYAPQARKDFMAALTARAALLGISATQVAPATVSGGVAIIDGVEWPAKVAAQRATLVQRIQRQGFAQTIEEVAYTWFNRLAALRYLELHDFLDHGYRVLSSRDGGLPELLRHASAVTLPGLNPAQVQEMQLAGNQDNALYKLLLVAQCNELSRTLPFLFERIDDDTELLLPDNLLHTDSIIAKLVAGVPEEDWQDIEVIGWLYQFYISEKKDQVIGKVVKSEDIPAATQLFTPNWIVQYLVQNSVGRLWLMANPGSSLAQEWPYYIQPAEQTPEVQAQLDALIQTRIAEDGGTLNPETITVLDPACGSGHILVVAYDVLKAIYLERGYRLRDIPRLILEKNLYGLDIDDRAAQMAGFALLMKARADDRRLLSDASQPPRLNIHSLQTSQGLDADTLCAALAPLSPVALSPVADTEWGNTDLLPGTQPQRGLEEAVDVATGARADSALRATVAALIANFAQAKTLGSLIKIGPQCAAQLPALREWLEPALHAADLYAQAAAKDLWPLLQQAQVLAMQFDAVVANPPYMGGKYLTPMLKNYLKAEYAGYEKDLFSAFMMRDLSFAKPNGQLGFMSPFVWMFISSYEQLRTHFIDNATLTSLIQLEYSGFDGATVPICTFTLAKQHVAQFVGSYVRLSDFKGADQQGPKTLEAIQDKDCGWFYTAKPDDFKKISGSPVAYWLNNETILALAKAKPLSFFADTRKGMITLDDAKFTRRWFEVSLSSLFFASKNSEDAMESGCKWFPITKGGGFRKWSGSDDTVVNWFNNGKEIKENIVKKYNGGSYTKEVRSESFYFKPSISWGLITSAKPSFRSYPNGFIIGNAGPCLYLNNETNVVLPLLNSKVGEFILSITSPTLNFAPGDISRFPIVEVEELDLLSDNSNALINIHRNDWNDYEVSWEFSRNKLIDSGGGEILSNSFERYLKKVNERQAQAKSLEVENNEIFINAYGLQDELSPEVPESQITLTRADREKDCQRLISYAIGCMMGRYSLDAPGLIYAHAGNIGFDPSRYPSFPADADGILPITDELWFADDAPERVREFLQAVWGPDTLAENLAWLAESLSPKASETPEETIRRYIASKFFKDHLQTYKKRPIYWLFSSGKQGAFQALVYLHRYHEGTLARMRAEYVIPLSAKMANRLEMLEQDANAASSTAARTKLRKQIEALRKKHTELLAYDEKLRHYADMRITLDLDDGVKVNYGKFGDLLEGVKLVTGGSGDE